MAVKEATPEALAKLAERRPIKNASRFGWDESSELPRLRKRTKRTRRVSSAPTPEG